MSDRAKFDLELVDWSRIPSVEYPADAAPASTSTDCVLVPSCNEGGNGTQRTHVRFEFTARGSAVIAEPHLTSSQVEVCAFHHNLSLPHSPVFSDMCR